MTKTAIVTGAMGGIGYATVQLLLANNFNVVGMDIAPADACADKISPLGDRFAYVSGNLASAEDRQALLDAALSHFGAVHALVNVAGVAPKVRRDLLEMTEESYDFVMDINTKGTLFLSQLVANQMVKQDDRDAVGNRGYTFLSTQTLRFLIYYRTLSVLYSS